MLKKKTYYHDWILFFFSLTGVNIYRSKCGFHKHDKYRIGLNFSLWRYVQHTCAKKHPWQMTRAASNDILLQDFISFIFFKRPSFRPSHVRYSPSLILAPLITKISSIRLLSAQCCLLSTSRLAGVSFMPSLHTVVHKSMQVLARKPEICPFCNYYKRSSYEAKLVPFWKQSNTQYTLFKTAPEMSAFWRKKANKSPFSPLAAAAITGLQILFFQYANEGASYVT